MYIYSQSRLVFCDSYIFISDLIHVSFLNNSIYATVKVLHLTHLQRVYVCYIVNMSQKCSNDLDSYEGMCRELTFKSQRRNFTSLIEQCYFGFPERNQNKSWVPYKC